MRLFNQHIKNISIVIIIVLVTSVVSCEFNDNYEFPKEVLDVPNNDDLSEDIFSTTATDINNNGLIVGYSCAENAPFYRFYEYPSTGFVTSYDELEYRQINREDMRLVWPKKINDNNRVAGSYLPPGIETIDYENETILPSHAFVYDYNTDVFTDIHPDEFHFSGALCINNNGLVGGIYGNETDFWYPHYACLFNYDTVPISLHPEGAYSSEVSAINDNYIVVMSSYNPGEFEVYKVSLYDAHDLSLKFVMPLTGIEYFYVEVGNINNNNILVGHYLDKSNALRMGFTYKPGDKNINVLHLDKKINGWEYYEFGFYDINDNNVITGITGRSESRSLAQARAAVINLDFSGFADITPRNKNSYAEAYAINNQDMIVGYAGFMQKHALVINRAFALTHE